MRYVYTQVGDEKVRRNDVEYVHLKLSALGIVVMCYGTMSTTSQEEQRPHQVINKSVGRPSEWL